MFECQIEISIPQPIYGEAHILGILLYQKMGWERLSFHGDKEVIYKCSVDLAQVKYLCESLLEKINKNWKTRTKVIQIIQDWSE